MVGVMCIEYFSFLIVVYFFIHHSIEVPSSKAITLQNKIIKSERYFAIKH